MWRDDGLRDVLNLLCRCAQSGVDTFAIRMRAPAGHDNGLNVSGPCLDGCYDPLDAKACTAQIAGGPPFSCVRQWDVCCVSSIAGGAAVFVRAAGCVCVVCESDFIS